MQPPAHTVIISLIVLHSCHLTLENNMPDNHPNTNAASKTIGFGMLARIDIQSAVNRMRSILNVENLFSRDKVKNKDEAKEEVKDKPAEEQSEGGILQAGYDYVTGTVGGILTAPVTFVQAVYNNINPLMYYWDKSYNVIRNTKFENMSWEQQVKAVVPALTEEVKQEFPKGLEIYGVEIKEGVKYLCAAKGEIRDIKSIKFVDARTEIDGDTVILYATYKFDKLYLEYDALHISYMGVKLKGKLVIPFTENEVTFVGKVPKMSEFLRNVVTQNCLLYIVDFKVNSLIFGKSQVVARSIVRRYLTQRNIRSYIKANEHDYKMYFQAQVLSEMNRLLTTSGTWLCKDKALETRVQESEGTWEQPEFSDQFKRVCLGEKIPKKGKKKS